MPAPGSSRLRPHRRLASGSGGWVGGWWDGKRGGEEGGGGRAEGEAGRNANSSLRSRFGSPVPVRPRSGSQLSPERCGGGIPHLLTAPLTVASGLAKAPPYHRDGAREEDAEDR